jgi:hypothetical protein
MSARSGPPCHSNGGRPCFIEAVDLDRDANDVAFADREVDEASDFAVIEFLLRLYRGPVKIRNACEYLIDVPAFVGRLL